MMPRRPVPAHGALAIYKEALASRIFWSPKLGTGPGGFQLIASAGTLIFCPAAAGFPRPHDWPGDE